MKTRVGIGYDVHRLTEGRKLILGGVEIPFEKGLEGHSDADVILHAICDAMLGALALGDIGDHFPNTDSRFKDVSSLVLLEHVNKLIKEKGYSVVNIDTAIQAEAPKLKEYKEQMRNNIAQALSISNELVSIKATTQEGLGSIGKGEGIAAFATALLEKE